MEVNLTETEIVSKKKMVAFELPEEWYCILKKCADENFMNVSSYLRLLIYKGCLQEKLEKINKEKENC